MKHPRQSLLSNGSVAGIMYGMPDGSQQSSHQQQQHHRNYGSMMYSVGGGQPMGGMYPPSSSHGYVSGTMQSVAGSAAAGGYMVNTGGPEVNTSGVGGGSVPMGDGGVCANPIVNDYGYMADSVSRGVGVFSTGYAVTSGGGNGGLGYGRGGSSSGGRCGRGRRGGGSGADGLPIPDDYEVHDNQLKAPVAVRPTEVVPTAGSMRLFSGPPQPVVFGSRNVFRICEAFQEGRCAAAEKCYDVHVLPEFLHATRQHMTAWLQSREDDFHRTLYTDPTHTVRIFVTDLKEVVDVPVTALTFTKGLYVDPTTRARRTRAAHAHGGGGGGQNVLAGQVPTGCGLFAADPSQCKWGRWCNQVHIDPVWMQEKKEGFQHWFEKLESDFEAYRPDHLFTVHDPHLKASLQLPKYSVASFTRGLFQGSSKKAPSVCLLFQKGRCTAGSCCNQIHIIPEYLNLVRAKATEVGGDPLGQQPSAAASIARELDALGAALLARQQHVHQQQQYSEQMPMRVQSAPPPLQPEGMSSDGARDRHSTMGRSGGGDAGWDTGADSYNDDCSGALFEHIPVDDDPIESPNPPQLPQLLAMDSHNSGSFSESTGHTSGIASGCDGNGGNGGGGSVVTGARRVNPNGSYTNNPYASVTSLPDAFSSYSSRVGAVGSGTGTGMPGGATTATATATRHGTTLSQSQPQHAGSSIGGGHMDSSTSFSTRAPASLHTRVRATVHMPDSSTGGQPAVTLSGRSPNGMGGRAISLLTSPSSAGMLNYVTGPIHRSGSNSNASASGTNGPASASGSGHAVPPHQPAGYGSGMHSGSTAHGSVNVIHAPSAAAATAAAAGYSGHGQGGPQQRPYHGGSGNIGAHPLNRSHTDPEHLFTPQDFDRSLHFSPSPLLNLSIANTSGTRHPRDDCNVSSASSALRMGGASTSAVHNGYPQQPHTSQQQQFHYQYQQPSQSQSHSQQHRYPPHSSPYHSSRNSQYSPTQQHQQQLPANLCGASSASNFTRSTAGGLEGAAASPSGSDSRPTYEAAAARTATPFSGGSYANNPVSSSSYNDSSVNTTSADQKLNQPGSGNRGHGEGNTASGTTLPSGPNSLNRCLDSSTAESSTSNKKLGRGGGEGVKRARAAAAAE